MAINFTKVYRKHLEDKKAKEHYELAIQKPRPHKFLLYEQLLRDAEKYYNEQDYEVSQQILQILKTKLENDN